MNQNPNYIEFKKVRELGDIITDTFAFVRTQGLPFFTTFLKITAPYLLIFVMASIYHTYITAANLSNLGTLDFMSTMGANAILIITSVIAYVVAQSVVIYYIQSYIKNNGNVNTDEVSASVNATLLKCMGAGVLSMLLLVFAFILLLIPGIYAAIPMSLLFCVMLFEKRDIQDSIRYSFTLSKGNWWSTFGTLFVMTIIVSFMSIAFSLPTIIYTWFKMGVFSGSVDPATMSQAASDPIALIMNTVSVIGQYTLYVFLYVSIVFIYFSLNEQKNQTGTLERIQNIGKTDLDQ